ncbi:MAG: hypothetical protein AB7F19_02670 [Candidatus Babeliales bacterium]
MNKRLLSSLCIVLLLTTPLTKAGSWWDVDKDSKVLPIISAGLAAAGIAGLATWLLSESDYDVINQAESDLHNVQQRYNNIRYAYEQTTYDRYAQEQELKRVIKQQCGHEEFYLIAYHDRLGTSHKLLRSQMNKVKERLHTVESKMAKLSRHNEKFDVANRARIQLNDILHDLEKTAAFLGDLHQRIGSWPELAQQHKKHRKYLAKLEQERKERERERKIRDQQYELDRMNDRVRQLEREKRAAYERSHCNCVYESCIHVHVN